MDDIKWFVGLLLILGLLWIGGKNRDTERATETASTTPKSAAAPVQKVPDVRGVPDTVPHAPAGTIISESEVPSDPNVSPLSGYLSIGTVQHGVLEKEYVVILASSRNTESINITGLTIRSGVTLNGHVIGKGWSLYFPQTLGEGDPIFLRPGGKAVIASGRSPMPFTAGPIPNRGGFQLNRCTGFFEQGMNFYPTLPLDCPRPQDEPLPVAPNTLSDDCYEYLGKIKRCTVPSSVPENLAMDGNCQAHVFNRINYNQCVVDNKDLPNFYKGEWRIYLGRTSKLWKPKHDIVELLDTEGKLIDARTY